MKPLNPEAHARRLGRYATAFQAGAARLGQTMSWPEASARAAQVLAALPDFDREDIVEMPPP